VNYVGQPVKRFEDPKLINRSRRFVDDIKLPDMLYASSVAESIRARPYPLYRPVFRPKPSGVVAI
jgi:CO/xanthine dehydrogenase Mo-binding subunit